MSRRVPQPPRVIQLKDSDKLQQYISDMLSATENNVKSAARHGVSETVNQLIKNTIDQIATSKFKGMTPSKQYGVPLYYGVRGLLVKNEPTGIVHILGPKYNDGTWRLRFWEHGTKQRKTRKGYNRGRLEGWYFFKKGTSQAESIAVANVQSAIEKTIDELNQ